VLSIFPVDIFDLTRSRVISSSHRIEVLKEGAWSDQMKVETSCDKEHLFLRVEQRYENAVFT